MPYIFKKTPDPTNHCDRSSITFEIEGNDITLPNLIQSIEDFLRGCGFSLPIGALEIVDVEEKE